MTTWQEYKLHIVSIPPEELELIDALSVLQATRFRRDISQKDLAARMGMRVAQLAKIERLDAVPSLRTLCRYAAALEMKIKLSVTDQKDGELSE
ncbi:helix-turn-helix domain-containing protein [Lacticaseibacillus mingshuiensis]|uniref:Helix-turn-helix domain-containing protein n=1 Tax=Lacticaseibacillus mingshuiensis TaxID=2799574 RepID=A0ABW4CI11_9LACO|nr:helix-turn-helix transcriptional regulator [Lacticaseibacillus mingshuiensis]